jgi:hypothetical protein
MKSPSTKAEKPIAVGALASTNQKELASKMKTSLILKD